MISTARTGPIAGVENAVVAIQKVLVTVLLIAAFVCMAAMVPVRYFDLPMPDLGEASIACIVSLTFLCIGLLVRTGGHIAIEVSDLVRERRVKFAVRQLANLGILLFVATFGVQAYNLLASALRSGEASIALRIPLAVPFAALVIGLVLAAFHTLMNVVRDVRVLRAPGAVFENRSEGGEQA